MRLVAVTFGNPADEQLPNGEEYTYLSDSPKALNVGDWVWVPGNGGLSTAMVVRFPKKPPKGFTRATLSRIARPVKRSEITTLRQEAKALAAKNELELQNWWWHAAYCSGFTAAPPPHQLPEGFPALFGDKEFASKAEANEAGRAWWGIYKKAAREGKPQSEVSHYRKIADYWFQRRDAL